jgi:hypothetical protein
MKTVCYGTKLKSNQLVGESALTLALSPRRGNSRSSSFLMRALAGLLAAFVPPKRWERFSLSPGERGRGEGGQQTTDTSPRAYGYTNIFELEPLLNVRNTAIPFAGIELK